MMLRFSAIARSTTARMPTVTRTACSSKLAITRGGRLRDRPDDCDPRSAAPGSDSGATSKLELWIAGRIEGVKTIRMTWRMVSVALIR